MILAKTVPLSASTLHPAGAGARERRPHDTAQRTQPLRLVPADRDQGRVAVRSQGQASPMRDVSGSEQVAPNHMQMVIDGKSTLRESKIWLSKSVFNRHVPYGLAMKIAQKQLFRSITPNALNDLFTFQQRKQIKSFLPERIDTALATLEDTLKNTPVLSPDAAWRDALQQLVDALKPIALQWCDAFPALDVASSPSTMNQIALYESEAVEFLSQFFGISQEFMARVEAHPVDRHLAPHDKARALTNVWAQLLTAYVLEKPCELTEDLYALSIAYPHHDDILDDNTIEPEQKMGIIKQVFQILETGNAPSKTFSHRVDSERRLYSLVQTIHDAHKSCEDCGALPAVAALNAAQKLSAVQKDARTTRLPFEVRRNIWETLLTKGAATTVADAYLAFHKMNDAEYAFAGLVGMLGQLIKDIEDIDEDVQNGEHTAARISYENKRCTDLYLVRLLQTVKHFHDKQSEIFPKVSKARFNLGLALIGFRALNAAFTDNEKLSSMFRGFLANQLPVDPTYFFQNARNLERSLFETHFDQPIQPQDLRNIALDVVKHMRSHLEAFSH